MQASLLFLLFLFRMHAARDSSCFALVMHVASRSYATFVVAGNVLPLHTCLHVHCMSLACLLMFLSPFRFRLLFGVVFVAYCHDLLACACVCLFVAGADLARVSWHHAFCMVVKSAT